MKKIISAAVCTLLAMTLTGCSWFESHPIDHEAKEALVVEYMNEKYGKKFITGGSINPHTWAPKEDPFSEYYATDVYIENDPDKEKYIVYHDDNETHEEIWIIGDEYMMSIVEPYIRQFVEESLKKYAPCADTYLLIWGAGSSDIREQTTSFTTDFCFNRDFPVVSSYNEFLKQTKNIYLNLCIVVPDSEQDIESVDQDWKKWREYMYSNFNNNMDLCLHTAEDESFFGADRTRPDKQMNFNTTHSISLNDFSKYY